MPVVGSFPAIFKNYNYGVWNLPTVGTAERFLVAFPRAKTRIILNNNNFPIRIGLDSSVTTTIGFTILVKSYVNLTGLDEVWKGALYAVSPVANAKIEWIQWGQA